MRPRSACESARYHRRSQSERSGVFYCRSPCCIHTALLAARRHEFMLSATSRRSTLPCEADQSQRFLQRSVCTTTDPAPAANKSGGTSRRAQGCISSPVPHDMDSGLCVYRWAGARRGPQDEDVRQPKNVLEMPKFSISLLAPAALHTPSLGLHHLSLKRRTVFGWGSGTPPSSLDERPRLS